jgi:hypothetical protein
MSRWPESTCASLAHVLIFLFFFMSKFLHAFRSMFWLQLHCVYAYSYTYIHTWITAATPDNGSNVFAACKDGHASQVAATPITACVCTYAKLHTAPLTTVPAPISSKPVYGQKAGLRPESRATAQPLAQHLASRFRFRFRRFRRCFLLGNPCEKTSIHEFSLNIIQGCTHTHTRTHTHTQTYQV